MKEIENTNGLYLIDESGLIYNTKSNKNSANWITPKGYVDCHIKLNGKWSVQKVHRLVAKTFIENPNNYLQINHINGIKSDNRVENLEWCTQNHNMKHAYDNGLKQPLNKKVLCVETGIIYESIRMAGRLFGKHNETNISNVCNGRWKTAMGFHWEFVAA